MTHPAVGLSCEPDIVFVAFDSLRSDRIRYLNPAENSDKLIEMEGTPDLVVEIVSDSSVTKDLKRLPRLYAEAGIPELWIVDARRDQVRFEIRYNEQRDWQSATVDEDRYQLSRILARDLRIRREPGRCRHLAVLYRRAISVRPSGEA